MIVCISHVCHVGAISFMTSTVSLKNGLVMGQRSVRVPIFPIIVCGRSAYIIGAGVGFRVESGAVALLQLDL